MCLVRDDALNDDAEFEDEESGTEAGSASRCYAGFVDAGVQNVVVPLGRHPLLPRRWTGTHVPLPGLSELGERDDGLPGLVFFPGGQLLPT